MKKLISLLLFVITVISAQPTIPTGFSHSVALDGSIIVLSWDDNTDEDGYILRHNWIVDDPEGPQPQPGIFWLDSNTTEFEYNLARQGEKYSFQLSAYNEDGKSDYTSLIVVSTPRVKVIQSGESMTVTWDNIIGAQMYEVSIDVITKRNTIGPVTYQTTDNYLFSAVNCGYSYRVFVSAIGENLPQTLLNEEPVIIFIDCDSDQNPPLDPTNLKVVYTQKGALLRWNDNSDNEEGFWINKVVERHGAPSMRGWIHVSASQEQYLDEDVVYGSTYSYSISAYNESGWSYPSRYTYRHALPGVKVSLDLYDSNNIRIVWIDTIDYVKKEYYLLYWSPEDEDEFFNVDSINIDAEAVNFPSGFCGRNYFYVTTIFSVNGKQYESLSSDTVWTTITDPGICGTTDVDDEEVIHQFQLHQNYPNPFNPSTKISYSIPSAGHVSLKVYDILGSEVVTLLDTHQDSGKHQTMFDASFLPSGIYFYILETQAYKQTKKMILVK